MTDKLQNAIDKLKDYEIVDSPYFRISDGWKEFFNKRSSITVDNLRNFLAPDANVAVGIGMTNNSPEKEKKSFELLKKITLRKNEGVEKTIEVISGENLFGEVPLEFDSNKKLTRSNLLNAGTFHELLKAIQDLKKSNVKILEIGSGYGELSRQIIRYSGLTQIEYDCVDLPENLFMAEFYLSSLFGSPSIGRMKFFAENDFDAKYEVNAKIGFYDPSETESLKEEYDLVINTYSLQEMDVETVSNYIHLIHKKLSDEGIFFSINSPKKWAVSSYANYHLHLFENLSSRMHRQIAPAGIKATIPIVNVFKKKQEKQISADQKDVERTNLIGEIQINGFTETIKYLSDTQTLSVTSPDAKLIELLEEIEKIQKGQLTEKGKDFSTEAQVLAYCIMGKRISNDLLEKFLSDKGIMESLSDRAILGLSQKSNHKKLKSMEKEINSFYGIKAPSLIDKLKDKIKQQ